MTACGSTGSSFDTTAKNNVAAFIGKDLDGILAILGGNTAYPGNGSGAWLEAGASESTYSLYNAALFAELEITQRQNHSMIVSYVPPSNDAAIAGTYKRYQGHKPL